MLDRQLAIADRLAVPKLKCMFVWIHTVILYAYCVAVLLVCCGTHVAGNCYR